VVGRGHTQWFYFSVKNTVPGVAYKFNIVNMVKAKSLFNQGMRPVLYSTRQAEERGVGWRRCGDRICYYRNHIQRVKNTKSNYSTLTFTVQFEREGDLCYLACCYPYTYRGDLLPYLESLKEDPQVKAICAVEALCYSLAGNKVSMLSITEPREEGHGEATERPVVVFTGRVHPGESNSSWMIKGLVEFLLGDSPEARRLRESFVFKVVPMTNPVSPSSHGIWLAACP